MTYYLTIHKKDLVSDKTISTVKLKTKHWDDIEKMWEVLGIEHYEDISHLHDDLVKKQTYYMFYNGSQIEPNTMITVDARIIHD